MKILAIKFKYLGDVAVAVPALRALRAEWPQAELHYLVPEEAVPVVEGLPWLDRVWAFPRTRGRLRLRETRPLLKRLRQEKFDRSIDFVGNDRGAWASWLIGAKERLAVRPQRGFAWRRLLYTRTLEELDFNRHETVRDFFPLAEAWKVKPPRRWDLECFLREEQEDENFDSGNVLAHVSTSRSCKEWPVEEWSRFASLAEKEGVCITFCTGPSTREGALLDELEKRNPRLSKLPTGLDLAAFMQRLAKARLLISADTAPLHIAAGLGVPTVGLFGPTDAGRWAPPGKQHRTLQADFCLCSGHAIECSISRPCMSTIKPEHAWAQCRDLLEVSK